ncbi:ABC transporter substrate-binding protein [Halohasta salina]|uniref:ABC transporter substrate-binding protein n=1 Tax=Halohasta salina TaxID=2961621 RepID=UPI0020A5EEE0|nr:ABC transporter substrate-binding protein [Halohasta salina]
MTERSHGLSRRSYLAGIGSTAAVGVAGCLGGGDDGDDVTVAHMPIFPDLQYYVMESEGYLESIDATVESQEFTNGPDIVGASASGDIDIAMFGVVPAMIAIDRGIPAKVTAANIKEPMAIVADEELGTLWEEHGSDAFGVWEEQNGEQFTFGTFPQGSVPDVLLRYWLQEEGVDPEADVGITEINGANAVFQAIANGEVDGTSIMEPVPTRVANEDLGFETFRTSSEIMPGQPAAVTLMTDEVRESAVGSEFLRQHVRATEFIAENPAETAAIVEEGIGMPAEQAEQALAGPLANFVTDPAEIESGTEIFAEFAAANGQTDEQLTTDGIFDTSIYDSL